MPALQLLACSQAIAYSAPLFLDAQIERQVQAIYENKKPGKDIRMLTWKQKQQR